MKATRSTHSDKATREARAIVRAVQKSTAHIPPELNLARALNIDAIAAAIRAGRL